MTRQTEKPVGKVTARERARLAKATLDAERATREKRIEDAATEFYAASDQRESALVKVSEAESAMSTAIASLVTQDETVERIAALCGIQASEVRRLRKRGTDTASAASAKPKVMVKWMRGVPMRPSYLLLSPVREFLMFAAILYAAVVPGVRWRNRYYRLGWKSRIKTRGQTERFPVFQDKPHK